MGNYSFDKLKVCFVGVGSIASKHIKNLSDICETEGIELSVDALRRTSSLAGRYESEKLIDNTYYEVSELPEDYDVIFITNPTQLHIETLKSANTKAKHFFVEKPVVSYEKIDEATSYLSTYKGGIYYVACPLRYTDVIGYLKENIDLSKVCGVRSICSSYLPEWRPGTDYRKCYSARSELGGGVAVDLIHEWDYITYLFGFPENVKSMFTRKSSLEIDVEDCALYLAEYGSMTAELHLDYYGRKSLREIMIFTDEDTIVGDIIANKVTYLKEGMVCEFTSSGSDVSKRELRHFLDIIDKKAENDNDMENAIKVLRLTKS